MRNPHNSSISSSLLVRKMTGTFDFLRSSCNISIPSMRGILMSKTTRETCSFSTPSNPETPSV